LVVVLKEVVQKGGWYDGCGGGSTYQKKNDFLPSIATKIGDCARIPLLL